MKHKGQILLITVMVLATILTVVLSVSFQSITETQVSKLEEENQKALAAAEAGLEAALKSQTGSATFGSGSLSNITGFTGGASLITTTANNFTTPVLPQDAGYTFYLGDYNLETYEIGASLAQPVEICFQSPSPKPALEITLVKTTGIKKYAVDPENPKRINNALPPSSICSNSSFNYSYSIPASDIGLDAKILFVRTLYQGGRLYFFRSSDDLPLQGKTISSSAVSQQTSVSKKITLFQSYPQIPAEFFTAAF